MVPAAVAGWVRTRPGGIGVSVGIVFGTRLLPILMFVQPSPVIFQVRGSFADGGRSPRPPRNSPATVSVRCAIAPPGAAG